MGAQEPEEPFSRAGLGTVVRPPPNPKTLAASDHLELRPVQAADGLSHHGDPAEEEEVIVVEEPERPEKVEHRVVRKECTSVPPRPTGTAYFRMCLGIWPCGV